MKSDNVTNISKYNYAFDNTTHKEGRISMERQYQATTLQHINYGYDNISQLTSALSTETPTALENFTYSYDAMGNHNQWKKGGGSTVTGGITKTYTNNNLNQVTNLSTATNTAGTVTTDTLAMSYDLQGGLNVSYPSNGTTYSILIYDDANRLKQVIYRLKSTDALSKQVLYVYDGANRKRRTIEEDWNGTAWTPVSDKRYVYDGMNVLQERNGTGTTVVAKHVWGQSMGGGIGGLLSRTEVSTSANYFYHYDGSGNVMQLTDSTQAVAARYDYDPWGVVQTNSGAYSSQPYRWSTKEQDAVTGLYYYGLRFYSPSLRTWINRDPIGEMGGLNLYQFVVNNPVNAIDLYGLDWELIVRSDESHAWIVVRDYSKGTNNTYGRWGYGDNGPGIYKDLEKGRPYGAERRVILRQAPKIPGGGGYVPFNNNCTSFAEEAWRQNTGESLPKKYGRWGWDDPSTLENSIKNANKSKPKLPPQKSPTGTGIGSSESSSRAGSKSTGSSWDSSM